MMKNIGKMMNEANGTDVIELTEEQLEAMRETIRESLVRGENGKTANSIDNCVLVLENDPLFKGKIRRNLLTGCTDLPADMPWNRESTMLTDRDLPFIKYHLETYYGLTSEKRILDSLEIIANRNAFHPIRERLESLKWDGIPRVRCALHRFLGAEENDLNEECLRTFMLGAAERIFHPGCKFELMLCLTGGQGAGKTTFVRFLALEDEWFSDDLRRLDDENVYRKMMGHWIIELSEMIATSSAKSIEEIKSFLSRQKDTYKVPYDRFPADYRRQCVFAGTTNRLDFLPLDRSGNRRFMPVRIDPEKAEIHILENEAESRAYFEQMWAEIMEQCRSGNYSLRLSKKTEAVLKQEQKNFMPEDVLAGVVYDFIEKYAGNKLCSRQIWYEALNHSSEYDEPARRETLEIHDIVEEGISSGEINGWRSFRNPRNFPEYGRQKGWERIPEPDNRLPATEEKAEQLGFTVVDEPEDFPFKDLPDEAGCRVGCREIADPVAGVYEALWGKAPA